MYRGKIARDLRLRAPEMLSWTGRAGNPVGEVQHHGKLEGHQAG
jgi:hypothetical protein